MNTLKAVEVGGQGRLEVREKPVRGSSVGAACPNSVAGTVLVLKLRQVRRSVVACRV